MSKPTTTNSSLLYKDISFNILQGYNQKTKLKQPWNLFQNYFIVVQYIKKITE